MAASVLLPFLDFKLLELDHLVLYEILQSFHTVMFDDIFAANCLLTVLADDCHLLT